MKCRWSTDCAGPRLMWTRQFNQTWPIYSSKLENIFVKIVKCICLKTRNTMKCLWSTDCAGPRLMWRRLLNCLPPFLLRPIQEGNFLGISPTFLLYFLLCFFLHPLQEENQNRIYVTNKSYFLNKHKLAKLRRHASQVYSAKIHFG